ncbi:lipoprotein-anchoring transpeptidase ErfK/SrfK [Bradyrhizobium japonicum]|nr:lipoprotein-anchoring transpeptidase ErfK/SrfK [Bradyrhizobium japonicum]MCS3989859.1 lipoprotein-anchoring transpeptidase ErfK/SrfK [Bradyrhizobium japonicum]MCS4015326.1 lipoprotein-anchoring transpeptidase ErfK/SrfK [Bradyrhizobium japonicum]MCS4202422.1 lipoprotein-anchoring transpeptidase ErfK/SrfK [Bradyrhizobium japonicum]MDH6174445.1 lipoprotein-anchoring transpeptidase ErfK/SrfK [Bradyrhizobium japonicum]
MLPHKSSALTIANGSSRSEIASKFLKFCRVRLPGIVTWGKSMGKRAKRKKAEALAIPMAARVAIGAVAVAVVGYSLLSSPADVQPIRKPSAHEAQASSTPVYVATPARVSAPAPAAIPVPAPIPAPAALVEPPKADAGVPGALVRQVVDYASRQAPGTVIIDTGNTFLYFVLNDRQAMRYGIGVGREGFTWSGEQTVARKAEWPDWHPPVEMVSRQPYLPRFMAGGPGNPLGARAMYLGETEYRIHGTNNPDTIGKKVSSGCIRLTNDDVTDLYERVKVGAKVIVLPATAARRPSQGAPADAAFRLPDPASPSKRPLAANAQMLSSGPKIAEVR